MQTQGTIYFPEHHKHPKGVKEEVEKDIQEKIIPDEKEAEREISKAAVQDERTRQKMEALVQESQKYLLKISTHYFFELEPKDIIIDITKISIITRPFLDIPLLGAKEIQSILIDNITDVRVESIPYFATLKIIEPGTTHTVKYLKKDEATLARQIIQGLLIFKKNGLSLTGFDRNTLLSKLETIGKTVENT